MKVETETVSEAVKIYNEDSDIDKISKLSPGDAHATFEVKLKSGKSVVAIFCHKPKNEHRFQVAAPVMEKLNSETALPVPEVLYFDFEKDEIPFMFHILEKMEGDDVDFYTSGKNFQYFSERKKRSLLRDAGRKLAILHESFEYDKYGHLEYFGGLEVDEKESWSDLLYEIINDEAIDQMSEPFIDLIPEMRDFLKKFSPEVETGADPVLVHQDYSWNNLLVEEDEVNAILDWERAVIAHPELDYFTAESRLARFKTRRSELKYRNSLARGYRSIRNFEDGWRDRRIFYEVLKVIEAMWTFEGWKGSVNDEEEAISNLRRDFDSKIEKTRKRLG